MASSFWQREGESQSKYWHCGRPVRRAPECLPALTPWLTFISDLFIRNVVDAERSVRDQQLSWPWQGAASVKVAIDSATKPADLSGDS